MIDRTSWCFDIHHTISMKLYNGVCEIGPCCLSDHVGLDYTDTHEINQHKFLVKLRQENLEKKIIPHACRVCSKIEASGLDSRRSNHLKHYDEDELTRPGVRMLDIHLPNLCNLKCVICGPHNSSSWIADAEMIGRSILPEWKYKKSIQSQIKNLAIPDTVEIIKFWGGEPLLDDSHMHILEIVQRQRILENQRLIYNTNATVKVDENVLEMWSKSKLLEIYFSIDDINERSDYQRSGSQWHQLQENLNWYYDNLPNNHLLYVSCSYSWLNIWNLPRVVDWHKENFSVSRFGDQIQLIFNSVFGTCEISKINPDFFKALQSRFKDYPMLQGILDSLVIEPGYCPTNFIGYIGKLDQVRHTDYSSIFEEHSLIGFDR